MKTLSLTIGMLLAVLLSACNAEPSKDKETAAVDSEELQVYYFHFTKRCATCNAVENETKVALEMFYPDLVKEGTIAFTSLNLEEKNGKEVASQLKVSGQALLLIKGKEKVDLTNEGFMNARTKPARYHEVLRAQIDQLL